MNEYVVYREKGQIEAINAGKYAPIKEWMELCRETRTEFLGIGLFDNDISAIQYYHGLGV